MTNVEMLKNKIASQGYKLSYVAEQLNLSRAGLYKKLNNKTQFNQFEIETLCDLLSINDLKEKEEIFFAK